MECLWVLLHMLSYLGSHNGLREPGKGISQLSNFFSSGRQCGTQLWGTFPGIFPSYLLGHPKTSLSFSQFSCPALSLCMNAQKGLWKRIGRAIKSLLSSEAFRLRSHASRQTAFKFAEILAVFFLPTLKMASSFLYYSTMGENRHDFLLFQERLVTFWT